MPKELKLQDRLRVAKHFNAAFELQPEQVDWIDAALTQLRSNKIEQTSADVAYQQMMLKKADFLIQQKTKATRTEELQ